MKRILFIASIAIFIFTSCENKDRLEEIKAELKLANKKDNNSADADNKKVSFSAPSQNYKEQSFEEVISEDSAYDMGGEYGEGDYSEDNMEYEEEYEPDYESEDEY
jgi:hypothetical protein